VVEALVEIDTLLHKLPIKARQALLMRQLEGKSYKEIAFELEVSVSSVEKYVAKGLQGCMLAMLNEG
jgi:RNA polymerase sigma-70 factor (ECF subfamily)